MLVLVQIFSFVAVIVATLSKKKKNIITWVFIANFSNFLVMLLANEVDGYFGSFATTLRGFLFLYKDKAKTNTILYVSILLHIFAFVLSYQDVFSFCIVIATLMVCISQWYGNPMQIKVFALISILLWIIYTIHIGLYLDLPKRIVEGALLIFSIISLQKSKKKVVLENTTNS